MGGIRVKWNEGWAANRRYVKEWECANESKEINNNKHIKYNHICIDVAMTCNRRKDKERNRKSTKRTDIQMQALLSLEQIN